MEIIIAVVGAVVIVILMAVLSAEKCPKCKSKNVDCYDCEILDEYVIHKDVKIKDNNKDRWVRKAFKIKEIEDYYECLDCKYKYIKKRKDQKEL